MILRAAFSQSVFSLALHLLQIDLFLGTFLLPQQAISLLQHVFQTYKATPISHILDGVASKRMASISRIQHYIHAPYIFGLPPNGWHTHQTQLQCPTTHQAASPNSSHGNRPRKEGPTNGGTYTCSISRPHNHS